MNFYKMTLVLAIYMAKYICKCDPYIKRYLEICVLFGSFTSKVAHISPKLSQFNTHGTECGKCDLPLTVLYKYASVVHYHSYENKCVCFYPLLSKAPSISLCYIKVSIANTRRM